jgi:proton-dependent oligopeptide transporter, POT family
VRLPDTTAEARPQLLPNGARLVIGYEFCERIGFYSMVSLLALFLCADRTSGGFGWDSKAALTLVGAFSGLMYATPVLGGWVADRVLGHRPALLLGGACMVAGYALLVLAAIAGGRAAPGAALGFFGAAPPGEPAHFWLALDFWTSLCALVTGNALIKSTLVVTLGDSFSKTDTRRERAYAYYYAGINLGGLVAGFAAGSISVAFGWPAAFSVSAVAMAIAFGAYLLLGRQYLRPREPQSQPGSAAVVMQPVAREAKVRLVILAIFAALLLVYSIGSFQLWGTMSLFMEHDVNRHIGSFEIPTPWFTSIEAGALIVAAPLFAALWSRLASRGREPDIVIKYALALSLGAAGLFCFAATGWMHAGVAKPGWTIPALGIVVQATGEVAAWTVTYGLVYRLAPPRLVAAVMGAFYACTLGLGGYLAGLTGRYAQRWGDERFFLVLAVVTAIAALLAVLIGPHLRELAASKGIALNAPAA